MPHDANRSRGATRKKDLVDVQWALKQKRSFGRELLGQLVLTRKKDRESWLPEHVGFKVGGTKDGYFVFERSDAAAASDDGDLPPSAFAALKTLGTVFGDEGAEYGEWRKVISWKGNSGMPDSTFRTAIQRLDARIRHEGDRYYPSRNATATAPNDGGAADELKIREAYGEMDSEMRPRPTSKRRGRRSKPPAHLDALQNDFH